MKYYSMMHINIFYLKSNYYIIQEKNQISPVFSDFSVKIRQCEDYIIIDWIKSFALLSAFTVRLL